MNKDGEPVATYFKHELDGKSYICLGDDCPLCEIGDEPCYRESFDLIDLND